MESERAVLLECLCNAKHQDYSGAVDASTSRGAALERSALDGKPTATPRNESTLMIHTTPDSEDVNALLDALLSMENRSELQRFLADLCTPSEIEAMVQRYLVARMLRAGKTGSEIVRRTGSSTATISRVNRSLRYGHDGYALALTREEMERERQDGPE